MIIDTSALLAIIFDEPDGPEFLRLVVEAPTRLISCANALEAWIVADRHENPAKALALDELLEILDIAIEAVTVQQARLARRAYHKETSVGLPALAGRGKELTSEGSMPDGVTMIDQLDEPSMGESSFKGRLPPLGGSPVTYL